jgi:two-component system response regulator
MPENTQQPPVHVLLVEDSDSDAELMILALEAGSLAVSIDVVQDGDEALLYLRGVSGDRPPPDLILLDLHLPKLHGLEVLRQIKEDKDLRRIPVIVFTSTQKEEEFVKVYDLQGNCCVAKPVDPEEFTEAVRRIESFWLTIASRARNTRGQQ